MLDLKYLFKDHPADWNEPPEDIELRLESERGTMLTILQTPGGSGKHPLVLINHGFPGTDPLEDAANAFRRIGFAVFSYHYHGCFGSSGKYSLSGVLRDAKEMLAFCRNPENQEKYGIDGENILLFGQSLGGFVTLQTAADCDFVRGAVAAAPFDFGRMYKLSLKDPDKHEALYRTLEDYLPWVNADKEEFFQKLETEYEKFDVSSKAEDLSERNIHIITGDRDPVAPADVHGKYIYDRIEEQGKGLASYQTFPTSHVFPDCRCAMIEAAAGKLIEYAER